MNYRIDKNGRHTMVSPGLYDRLVEALSPDADQETRDSALEELRSCRESGISRPRSTAADAVVLEPVSSTNPRN